MSAPSDVAILIVGLNAREYVRGCLQSLAEGDWTSYTRQTIYLDNASQDGTVELVRGEFPDVTVIANEVNVGFCRGCNQAAGVAHSRYVLFLNDDTVVYPDTIPQLVAFLDRTPEAAVAGCRLLYPDLREQWSARRFPTWVNGLLGRRSVLARLFPNIGPVRHYLYKDELCAGEPFRVDWVPGSCTLVRPEMLQRVGGFPEDLHYWSDAVFCQRITHAGGGIFLVPASRLIHYEGKGSGARTPAAQRWHIIDFHRGAFRFFCEHRGLGPHSITRWLAGAALAVRAALLIGCGRLIHTCSRTGRYGG